MRPAALVLVVLVLATGLSGCLEPAAAPAPDGAGSAGDGGAGAVPTVSSSAPAPPAPGSGGSGGAEYPACAHPYPCGDGSEWPPGLEGPFELPELREVRVASHDGVELHGWIYLPDVPEGVTVPTVVWSHPYFSVNYDSGDHPEYWENAVNWGAGLNVRTLVERGYAFAAFSVRGTAESGGCFSMGGEAEQRDQAFLVEWLADQEWSNGRVAMMGLSYHGTTPWEAAIQAPEALKTIVVAGMVSDWYTFYHTPQGAVFTIGAGFQGLFNALVGGPPRYTPEGPPEGWDAYARALPERACPEVAWTVGNLAAGTATDHRDAGFWTERRYIDGFPNVTAAVLLTHGFQDAWSSGHQMQESAAWRALPADTPKWMVEGQWGHEFPHQEGVDPGARLPDFGDRILAWLEFWLKGVGPLPDRLGGVDYQDGSGAWRRSTAWPPAEARDEALHLAPDGLAPAPGEGARAFLSAPDVVASERAFQGTDGRQIGPVCPVVDGPAGAATAILYEGAPVEEDVLVAGNPFAYLRITSDLPGGLVAVSLLDLGPDFACEAGEPKGARAWTVGVADLRFHAGNYAGRDFPTGEPTWVRVDLTNVAEVLPRGHRLGVLVSYNDPTVRVGQPFAPLVTVHGNSHLVLPVVEGALGGVAPAVAYPPRPFVPAPAAQGGL